MNFFKKYMLNLFKLILIISVFFGMIFGCVFTLMFILKTLGASGALIICGFFVLAIIALIMTLYNHEDDTV